MSDPAITVLMTVYNALPYLEETLASVAAQTFRDYEFLVIDDASTDGSREMLAAWQARDARLRVIDNAMNKGQTKCLNQGLSRARGAWIARQDADDLSAPDRLEKQYRAVNARPELTLLGTRGRIIDRGGKLMGLIDAPCSAPSIDWTAPFFNPFIHTAVLVRTAVVREEFGGYDEDYRIAQDYDLWTRIAAAHPTANLPDRLISYRHLATSLSHAGHGRAREEARRVSEREFRRRYPKENASDILPLIERFRDGLPAEDRRAFWALYRRLLGSQLDADSARADTVALHHLKAGGALLQNNKRAALAEVLTASVTSPATVARWIADRLS